MKFLIVVLALVVLAAADDNLDPEHKKAHDFINACIDETGVDKETAKKLKLGDFTVRDEKAQVRNKN